MISLAQIHAFVEVARAGSFASAGQRLSLPRSTVSARVRALEEKLNVRLLQRTTRSVALTDEGRLYLARCEEAIRKLEEAEAELSRSNTLSGTVRITVPVDMSKRRLAETLGAFVDRHPALRVEVLVTDEPLDLIAHNLDLALRGGAPGAATLVARKIGEDEVGFHASPGYVAARVPSRNLSDLSGHVIYDPLNRLPKGSGAKAHAGQIVSRNFELVKMLAIQSRGIALLPKGVCSDEVATGTLVQLSSPARLPTVPLHIVLPSRAHMPPRVRAFIDFLTTSGTIVR